MPFEDLPKPKRKKITDFFADGDPVHGSTASTVKTEHMGKEESRKQKYRLVTYLNKEQYDKFMSYCDQEGISSAEAVRLAVRRLIS